MRELSTRYGRDDIGFLWVIAEPIIFASAVSTLWATIKPPFENGIPIVPFTVTGYLPIILVRQTVGFTVSAVRVNEALLYHRYINTLHLYVARFGIEFFGITLAYISILSAMVLLNIAAPPHEILMVVGGWLTLSWLSFGLALIMGTLGTMFEFVERFVQVLTYIIVPLSGAFFMASSLPAQARYWVLYLPFIHCFEWMRQGYFGEFIVAYHNMWYAAAWAAILTLIGLVLNIFVRARLEVQ